MPKIEENKSFWKLLHAHINVWGITCTWTKADFSTLTVTRTRFLKLQKEKPEETTTIKQLKNN